MLINYLPGLLFLCLMSAIIATPFARLLRRRWLAVILATVSATVVLKIWAVVDIGGFDASFLAIVAGVAFGVSFVVVRLVPVVRAAT